MYETDGNTRAVTVDDIAPGVILRPVDSNGYTAPFSDVVVTSVYTDAIYNDMRFDVVRPYAFAHYNGELHSVEKIGYLSAYSLSRFRLVMLASGKPYTCIIGKP